MPKKVFKPIHINATAKDLQGNNGIGRYIFLPGSDGRAQAIAKHFKGLKVKEHPRAHNLYMGYLEHQGQKIDVATIASGMGTGSIDIILNELHQLGAKRFLRVGTAGSLQTKQVKIGDVVAATSAVRDEGASLAYVPAEFPAVASLEMLAAIQRATQQLKMLAQVHFGIVHCKASLYGRQFAKGPMAEDQLHYMDIMRRAGVLATEMEASDLFILSTLFNHQLSLQGQGPKNKVYGGAILTIVSDSHHFTPEAHMNRIIEDALKLAVTTIIQLAQEELLK